MFDRSSDGESVLHALLLILSHCSLDGKSITGPVMESVKSFGGESLFRVFFTRPVLESISYSPRSGICLVVRRVRSLSYTTRLEILWFGT